MRTGVALTLIAVAAAFASSGTDTPSRGRTASLPAASLVSRSMIPGGLDRLSELLPPTQRVQVLVDAAVTRDPRAGAYLYSYRLRNEPASLNNVDRFAIAPVARPDSVDTPEHWSAFLYPYQESSYAVVWVVTDVGTLPGDYVDTGNIPPSAFDVRPGGSVEGFRFWMRAGPGREPIRFFASGFDTLPRLGESLDDEDPQPDQFERSVTGPTLGPAGPGGH